MSMMRGPAAALHPSHAAAHHSKTPFPPFLWYVL